MALQKYRVRWIDNAGLAVVERRHQVGRKLLFWPKYDWEGVKYFPSTADGFKWLIDCAGRSQPKEEGE